MEFKRITDTNSAEFKEAWNIYEASFPADERRNLDKHLEVMQDKRYNFFAVFDNGELVGVIAIWATWEFEKFVFVEHFAIKGGLRNKGYGKKVLASFLEECNKNIIGEVERPEAGEKAKKRIEFFQSYGFTLNTFDYIQPAYSKEKKPVPMYLMSLKGPLNETDYNEIVAQIHTTVYGLTKPLLTI